MMVFRRTLEYIRPMNCYDTKTPGLTLQVTPMYAKTIQVYKWMGNKAVGDAWKISWHDD